MNQENIPTPNSGDQEYESFRQKKHEGMKTPIDVIENAILEATGLSLSKLNRIIVGEVNEVYSAEVESGQEVIIRIFHGRKAKFYREQWVFEQCAKVEVPVPQMLLVKSIDVNEKPLEICVESKLPGVGLDKVPEINKPEKKEELIDLLHQIGKILSKIHSIPTNGFGVLDKNGNGKFSSVQELISGDEYIGKDKILPELADRPDDLQIVMRAYEVLEKESPNYSSSSPRLIHNDISPQHVLIEKGEVSGIIDMESACGADPVLEFARWDFKFGKDYPLKYLMEGYENQELFAGDFEKKLNFWKIYRSMTSLSYCIKEKKPTGINKSIRGLKESLDYF